MSPLFLKGVLVPTTLAPMTIYHKKAILSMAERVVEIIGLEKLLNDLDEFGKLDERIWFPVHDAMSEAVQQIEATAKDNLLANGSVAFGHLRASIASDVQVSETAIEGRVGTNLIYARPVEFGTKPHWPPLQPLVEWVRIKRLAGSYSVKTRQRLGSKALQQQQNIAVARAVQVKIARRGTKARPFFFPAIEAKKDEVLRLIERGVEQMVRKFNGGE